MMASDRLSTLLHTHYYHNIDYKEVVEMILNLHPRTITSLNLIWSNDTEIGTRSLDDL